MTDFAAKTVVITGASSGIGEALAKAVDGRGGAGLGLLARRTDRLEELAGTLRAQAVVLTADVTDRDQVKAAAERFAARMGAPDVLFINAGVGQLLTGSRVDASLVRHVMEVNFLGAVHVLEAFLPAMVERGGHVVVTSSVASRRGLPGFAAYSASKAALDRYVEGLRVQLSGRGVRFTTIEPGFIKTPLTKKNRFWMPFLLEADDAAHRIVKAVERDRRRLTFPAPMAALVKVLGLLPDGIYDRVMRRTLPAKKRTLPAKKKRRW